MNNTELLRDLWEISHATAPGTPASLSVQQLGAVIGALQRQQDDIVERLLGHLTGNKLDALVTVPGTLLREASDTIEGARVDIEKYEFLRDLPWRITPLAGDKGAYWSTGFVCPEPDEDDFEDALNAVLAERDIVGEK